MIPIHSYVNWLFSTMLYSIAIYLAFRIYVKQRNKNTDLCDESLYGVSVRIHLYDLKEPGKPLKSLIWTITHGFQHVPHNYSRKQLERYQQRTPSEKITRLSTSKCRLTRILLPVVLWCIAFNVKVLIWGCCKRNHTNRYYFLLYTQDIRKRHEHCAIANDKFI